MINQHPDHMFYPQAAPFLGISESRLRVLVMMRKIPHLKPYGKKGRVLFLRTDLEAFLEASRVPPIQAAAQ